MEFMVSELLDYGVVAIVLAVMIFQNCKVTARLFKVIESNTEAMTRLASLVEDLKK